MQKHLADKHADKKPINLIIRNLDDEGNISNRLGLDIHRLPSESALRRVLTFGDFFFFTGERLLMKCRRAMLIDGGVLCVELSFPLGTTQICTVKISTRCLGSSCAVSVGSPTITFLRFAIISTPRGAQRLQQLGPQS
jgi:hypothetical protein